VATCIFFLFRSNNRKKKAGYNLGISNVLDREPSNAIGAKTRDTQQYEMESTQQPRELEDPRSIEEMVEIPRKMLIDN
jgi:hypothetical protein